MNKVILIATLLALSLTLEAQEQRPRQSRVPATPNPIEWVQANGDTVTIRLIGDEHWSLRTTIDGYVIVEKEGTLYYARLSCKGEYRPSKHAAHNPGCRTKSELRYLRRMDKNPKLKRADARE